MMRRNKMTETERKLKLLQDIIASYVRNEYPEYFQEEVGDLLTEYYGFEPFSITEMNEILYKIKHEGDDNQ